MVRYTMIRGFLVAASLLLAACGERVSTPPAPAFLGTDLSSAQLGGELALTDHQDRARRLADFRGRAVALFFGYTQCPDVCPTALSTLAAAMQLLGPQAAEVQGVFVSVDPKRDTAKLLSYYVPAFHPGFVGLRGTDEAVATAARDFRIFYRIQPGTTPETYTIDHTAGMYLIDRQGRVRVHLPHSASPESVAHDLRLLLAEPPKS